MDLKVHYCCRLFLPKVSKQMLKIMKLIAIILFAACLQVSARGYSQITLSETNTPLQKVFQKIQQQSGYDFVSTYETLREAGNVTVNVQNVSLQKALEECLKGKPLIYVIIGKTVVVRAEEKPDFNMMTTIGKITLPPPNVEIHGRVVNQKGEPLPNVSVLIAGTKIGTTTDSDGRFTLTGPQNKNVVLEISSVGYQTKKVSVGNQTEINVVLESAVTGLNAVVIGFGTRNKRDITTSISSISSDKINNKVSLSLESAMQGKMAGVQVLGNQGDPFARQTVRIRGINTWGIASPLYVIDGIPITEYGAGIESLDDPGGYTRGDINVMSMIDPNDIESISVLKDAASAAIYGVRAGNGVILITTKKGKKGEPTIDYSVKFSTQNQYQHLDLLNTKDYADHFYQYYTSNGLPISSNAPIDAPFFDPSSPSYLGNNPTYDWQDAGKNKNALSQDHSIRLSGGSDKTDYSISFGYTNQQAVRLFSNLERYSGAINLNTKVNKYIRTGINLRIASESGHETPVGTIADRGIYPPWQPIYDPNGINGYATAVPGFMPDGTWNTDLKYGTLTRDNFLGTNSMSYNLESGLRGMGTAYVEIIPIKDLTLKASISIDRFNNEIHDYYQYADAVFTYMAASPLARPYSVGYYEERNTNDMNMTKDLSAHYTKSINKNNFDFLIDGTAQTAYAKVYKGYTYYMTTTDPHLFNLGTPLQPSDIGVTTFQSLSALAGVLFRGSYNYDHRYYLDITARRDGSSRFSPDTRWATFPGVSAAWRVTEEPFMKHFSWINDMKVRASWGTLGNQEVNDMAYLSTISGNSVYSFGTSPDGQTPVTSGATVSGMANKLLTWEKTTTSDVGVDFTILKNLSGTVEYYQKLTDGILQTVQLPLSAGVLNSPVQNIAQVSNKGFELTLEYNGSVNEFKYSIGGNFSTVKNRVTKMYNGLPMYVSGAGGFQSGIQVGYPMFFIRGYEVGGMFQSRQDVLNYMAKTTDVNYQGVEALIDGGDLWFKDIRSAPVSAQSKIVGYSTTPDGKVDQYDQTMIGNTIPGYFYGMNFSFEYKGFDLDIEGMGVGDVQKVNTIKETFLNTSAGSVNQLQGIKNSWTTNNTNTSIPRLIYGDPAANARLSNYWVENAAYLRLSNIQLGYSLNPAKIKQLTNSVISRGRVFVGCSNSLTITKYTGLDPEDDDNPAPVVFYMGLTVKF